MFLTLCSQTAEDHARSWKLVHLPTVAYEKATSPKRDRGLSGLRDCRNALDKGSRGN